jgi:UPF0716 family protein affecting phage T7 exclusion
MARIARIAGGFSLIVAGIFMLVLPGPGIVSIVAGLALLSKDMVWAGRLVDWVKGRVGKYAGNKPEKSTSEPTHSSSNEEQADRA